VHRAFTVLMVAACNVKFHASCVVALASCIVHLFYGVVDVKFQASCVVALASCIVRSLFYGHAACMF
jgi:hypothetical protein